MNNELLEALNILEKEKDISKDTLLEAIENSLITACKNHFGKSDNIKIDMNPKTCEFHVYAEKTVVEEVEDPVLEISLGNARMIDSKYCVGDVVNVEVKSKEFGRITTQNAKNVILQKIREEERKVLFDQYYGKEKDVVTGIVQRYVGKNILTIIFTRAPFSPTQAPTGSTLGSLLQTAILVLLPGSLEMLLISTIPSRTSVTSDSNRRFTSSGWVLDTRIFGPFEVDLTSRI